MRTDCINNTNFQGKFVIENRLSDKPKRCVKKVQDSINNLIHEKSYNLYLKQLYDKNVIGIYADYPFPLKPSQHIIILNKTTENIPINSNSSKYIEAAKNAIEKYDKVLREKDQKEWEDRRKNQKINDLIDSAETILFFPLFAVSDILHSINPKWSKKFEKYIEKII